ncbi:MAG: hypothetical protein ACK5AM_06950, partial [Pirellulaceae bacterium]
PCLIRIKRICRESISLIRWQTPPHFIPVIGYVGTPKGNKNPLHAKLQLHARAQLPKRRNGDRLRTGAA